MMDVRVKSPGKLVLAGEWSVLESCHSCIAVPVNKFVEVSLKRSDSFVFNAPQVNLNDLQASFIDGKFEWVHGDFDLQKAELARVTLQNVLNYISCRLDPHPSILSLCSNSGRADLNEPAHGECAQSARIEPSPEWRRSGFTISVQSELSVIETTDSRQIKPGLGSSSAVVVAITKAVLKFFDQEASPMIVFKLAAVAHYIFQKKIGSGVDVAVSAFEHPLVYKRFDPIWLQDQLEQKDLVALLERDWPGLEIKLIELPKKLCIVFGFSGTSASTTQLANLVQSAKKLHPEIYNKIVLEIDKVVCQLVQALDPLINFNFLLSDFASYYGRTGENRYPAQLNLPLDPGSEAGKTGLRKCNIGFESCLFKQKNQQVILSLIKQNRGQLKKLSELCSDQLEVPSLAQMISEAESYGGAAAKFSGAGGGDCCIAVCFDSKVANLIQQAWKTSWVLVY